MSVKVISFSLSVDGLTLSSLKHGVTTNLSFDASGTADLFKSMGFIEDFHLGDEPVILFTELKQGRPTTGFSYWCAFVKSFPMCERMAEMILEYREGDECLKTALATIEYLRNPQTAA